MNDNNTQEGPSNRVPPLAPGSAPTYPIRTLQDIWELPSYEHMERCFYDTTRAMLQARATNDLFVGLAQADGKDVKKAFMWPETMQWVDDGKNEIHTSYHGPDGKTFLEMRTTKSASEPNIRHEPDGGKAAPKAL